MKKILILFLLLGCQEPDYKKCNMALVISDASEIQFTPTGQSSFNLEQMGFTDDYCFHQKFLCSSLRRFQGYELDAVNDYYLIAFDEDGAVLYNEMFDKAFPNLFLQALADGENDSWSAGPPTWTIDDDPSISFGSPLTDSKFYWVKLYGAQSGTDYNFDYLIDCTIGGTAQIRIYVVDQAYHDSGAGSPLANQLVSSSTALASGTLAYTGTGSTPAYIGVRVSNVSGTTSAEIQSIDWQEQTADVLVVKHSLSLTPSDNSMCDKFVTFKIFDGPDPETDTEIYYTDSVEFVTTWANSNSEGRVDIQYKSVQNFADLLYDESSSYFQIQLTGRFRKERKQTAQKSLELTEMVLNTAASVKKQRKLTLDDMPDYMHTKVNLILAHAASGSVLVDGLEISVEEGYEEGDRPETYPLTPAENWLTIKDYYKHNVI